MVGKLVNNFNLDENIPKVDYFTVKLISKLFSMILLLANPLDINLHTVFYKMEI